MRMTKIEMRNIICDNFGDFRLRSVPKTTNYKSMVNYVNNIQNCIERIRIIEQYAGLFEIEFSSLFDLNGEVLRVEFYDSIGAIDIKSNLEVKNFSDLHAFLEKKRSLCKFVINNWEEEIDVPDELIVRINEIGNR